jgi:hypothetical protein
MSLKKSVRIANADPTAITPLKYKQHGLSIQYDKSGHTISTSCRNSYSIGVRVRVVVLNTTLSRIFKGEIRY